MRTSFIAAALVASLLACSGNAYAGDVADCSGRNILKSTPSTLATSVTFRNTSGGVRELDWIDFNGQLVHYATIPAKGTFTQQTFASHIWQLSDAAGGCVMLYVASGTNKTVNIP